MSKTKEQERIRSHTRYLKRMKEHRCVGCNCKLDEDWNKKLCPKCNSKRRDSYSRLMRYREENGLCSRCGREPREEGKKSCRACLDIQLDRMWIHRQNMIDAGKCPQCSCKLPKGYGYVFCDSCREKDKEKYARQKAKQEEKKMAQHIPTRCTCKSKPRAYKRTGGWEWRCACGRCTDIYTTKDNAADAWNAALLGEKTRKGA